MCGLTFGKFPVSLIIVCRSDVKETGDACLLFILLHSEPDKPEKTQASTHL